ncbi:MAG: Stk1 family PASTA domain-containing Ser/Thr kinase [Bacilli bacterium]|nr:Stk1 family PASTA domain-containing Ser/Thr kinase [Bacilli bacterium]
MIAKGQKISDRYQIIKSIGEGGMANVFLAFDTILERNVAVKVLRGDLATDEKFVRRFQREALSASSLTNENIVEVYDVGEDNGEYYIVMEYVEGKHLKNLIKKRGKLTIAEVVDIMLQVTSGLSVAHEQYIIHRDIKPQNIMILENGLVKLTDFGIAVAMNSTQLTQTNSVMGSVHYLPPEQASGKGATLQSDIYSLGILMYELLTGKLPYRGDNAVEIALKHLKEAIPSIRNELPDVPQSIENIIIKATAKNPKNRYADATEMHEDLKTCLEESRKKELKITYKYPEYDYDETKILKVKKDSGEMTKKESEEVIAKKITEGDLSRRQNKTLLILMSIFTGIVVVITTVVLLLPIMTKSKQVLVPNVSNMTISEATQILQDNGFVVTSTIEESHSKIEEGKVTKTNPAEGTKRKEGSEIKIYVSTGSKEIEIEDYIGENVDYIRGTLQAQGLKVIVEYEDIDPESDEDVEEDTIVKQSVEEGETLTKGDTITLYVPNIKNLYPNFTDGAYSVSDIIDFAEEYSVRVTFKDSEGNTLAINDDNVFEYNDYKIVSQNRAAGSKVTTGANLNIVLDVSGSSSGDCDGGLC